MDDKTRALIDQAQACDGAGDFAQSARLWADITRRLPQSWIAFTNLGVALKETGRPKDAITAYERAIALGGGAVVQSNLGLALAELDRMEAARAAHARAVAQAPDSAAVLINLGAFHVLARELDEAEAVFRKALALEPLAVDAHVKLGAVLFESGRPDEAAACLRHAVTLAPHHAEAHSYLAMALLAQGHLPEGFAEFEWRRALLGFPSLPDTIPEWRGGMLTGRTILLYGEQGLGDVLQFVRYASIAAAVGAKVVLQAPRPLVRLLASVPGVTQVIAEGQPLPPVDCHLPLLSMPLVVGTRLETIPTNIPYLRPDPAEMAEWAERLRDIQGLKVGLVWSGNPRPEDRAAHLVDRRRSLPLSAFAPLAAIPGVTFVSLQKGEPAAQTRTPPPGMALVDHTDAITDFAHTAALVANLDLVISVDTSVAHLAGALNKPVWILSRYDSCWRWLRNRPDSPWYPSARVFGQTTPGDWDSVMARLAEALRQFSPP
jgi:Flp pilus assembly protein TadD